MRPLGRASDRIGTEEHREARDGTLLTSVKLMMLVLAAERPPVRTNVLFGVLNWNWINRKRQVRSARDTLLSSSWADEALEGRLMVVER